MAHKLPTLYTMPLFMTRPPTNSICTSYFMLSVIHKMQVVGESSACEYSGPKSPKRTKDECWDKHMYWDPGGIRVFHGLSPPGEFSNEASLGDYAVPSTDVKENDVHVSDEDQPEESKGTVGLRNKPKDAWYGLGDIKTTQSQPNEGRASASENARSLSDDKGQESDGTNGTDTMKHIMPSKEVMPSAGELVMVPCMSLPVKDDSYVLGLRPIACSDTYGQLEKADYVTGMLPFIK